MRKTNLLLFALFLALLVRGAHAQTIPYCEVQGTANVLAPWYCSQINQAVASVWYQWAPIATIAISVAFLIAAVMLMMGIALQHEKLRNFAIGEMYEAAATAIIVVMFLTLAATMFGIIPSFVTGPTDPYDTALTYISQTINATQLAIRNLYNVVMIQSFYSSITLSVGLGPAGGIANKVGNALTRLINPYANIIAPLFIAPATVVAGLLIEGLMVLTGQFYMLLFFMYVSLPVFLIPGIIMRAIFPLRSVGGMLIAVAISFYMIMPILFSIAYYFTNTSYIAALQADSQVIGANGQGSQSITNAASPTAPLVIAVNGIESAMGGYFLSVLFYPALILALTYFSMETIAEFVGGISKTSERLALI